MSYTKSDKMLIATACFVAVAMGLSDGADASESVPAEDGIRKAMHGLVGALAETRDVMAVTNLTFSQDPRFTQDRIELSGGATFDFLKNEICASRAACFSMASLSAHNKKNLKEAACDKAADAGASGRAFASKYCADYKP